jgi:hypothetical protein
MDPLVGGKLALKTIATHWFETMRPPSHASSISVTLNSAGAETARYSFHRSFREQLVWLMTGFVQGHYRCSWKVVC